MMSKEELDIVQMTLIARIEEEIGWLNIMKNSWNPRKSIENMIVRRGEELKREMSNIYEQADKIEDLTMKYLEDIGIVHKILDRNNIEERDRVELDSLFNKYVYFNWYKQRLLYILSDGAEGIKDE